MVAAGAYYLAACWLVLRAARGPSPQRSALLAGVLLACAVHTHLFVVAFFPLVGLLYWSASSPEQVRPAARGGRHLLLLAIGALSITMVLMVINGVTGGEWLFFENQIDFTLREWGSETYPLWKDDPFEWLPTAMHLVIPVLFMLAGLTQLSRSTGQPSSRLRNSLVVQAWAAFAILCFFQFARRVPMLDQDYFAFVAYFYAFPCVAAALASDDAFEGRDTRLLTVAVAALVLVGSLMVLLPGAFPRFVADTSAAIGLAGLPPVALPVAVGFVGVVVMMLLSGPMRLIAFALWFAVVNTWIAPSPADYGIRTPGSQQQMVALFREADRFTTELDPTLGGIKYWFPKEDIATSTGTLALNWVFDSFLSTRGWSASLFGQESPGPAIDTLTVEHLSSTTCLGLLSSVGQHDDLKRKLSIHFDRLGHPLTEVAHRRFERPALTFALTVFKPLSATETLPQCWPLRTQ
jgi:hypothetical protein